MLVEVKLERRFYGDTVEIKPCFKLSHKEYKFVENSTSLYQSTTEDNLFICLSEKETVFPSTLIVSVDNLPNILEVCTRHFSIRDSVYLLVWFSDRINLIREKLQL